MVNLEEIKGEKKHYKTPVMEVEYLTWADIVTSSQQEAPNRDTPLEQYSGDDGGSGGTTSDPWG